MNTASYVRRRFVLSLLLGVWMIGPAGAVDFDDGGVHDISSPLDGGASGARVFDSSGGDPTTLNALSGAEINGIDVFDASIVNIFDGSMTTFDLNANDESVVSIHGGTLLNADVLNDATLDVSGGTFTGAGGRAIGTFGNAMVTITGGSFIGSTTYTLLSQNASIIELYGAAIDGEIRSEDTSAIHVRGGTGIDGITARGQSIMTLYGLEFSISSLGPVSLATPFVISDDTYNSDLLTGTLADGSAISADIFNGISDSQIVLVQAVPVPAAVWLLGSALVGLAGITRSRRSA